MSHTDNTAKKFDTNIPEWLLWKLIAKDDEPLSASRQAQKRQWKREIEMELSA